MTENWYWIISLIILGLTAYAVYISPIKAVKVGRKLNEEQSKYDAKENIFLTLFALRGDPIHNNFVMALNQIDVVFQDNPKVLSAWEKFYDNLNQKDVQTHDRNLLQADLLSEMSKVLGYNSLKQTTFQKSYYPRGWFDNNLKAQDHQEHQKSFFQFGSELYQILIDQHNNHLKSLKEKDMDES